MNSQSSNKHLQLLTMSDILRIRKKRVSYKYNDTHFTCYANNSIKLEESINTSNDIENVDKLEIKSEPDNFINKTDVLKVDSEDACVIVDTTSVEESIANELRNEEACCKLEINGNSYPVDNFKTNPEDRINGTSHTTNKSLHEVTEEEKLCCKSESKTENENAFSNKAKSNEDLKVSDPHISIKTEDNKENERSLNESKIEKLIENNFSIKEIKTKIDSDDTSNDLVVENKINPANDFVSEQSCNNNSEEDKSLSLTDKFNKLRRRKIAAAKHRNLCKKLEKRKKLNKIAAQHATDSNPTEAQQLKVIQPVFLALEQDTLAVLKTLSNFGTFQQNTETKNSNNSCDLAWLSDISSFNVLQPNICTNNNLSNNVPKSTEMLDMHHYEAVDSISEGHSTTLLNTTFETEKSTTNKDETPNDFLSLPQNAQKIGNIYNAPKVKRVGLRNIVIDGSNVALSHSNGRFFSVEGLCIAIDYFLRKGHKVTTFVPNYRLRDNCSNPGLFKKLVKDRLVVLTPSRYINGRRVTSYDDRYIIQYATVCEGIVVSNDQYRDLIGEHPEWRDTIENRLLMPTWVGDILIFPEDPLGRYGPSLSRFLRFP